MAIDIMEVLRQVMRYALEEHGGHACRTLLDQEEQRLSNDRRPVCDKESRERQT